ncbi:MAG: deoxyribose-phosphate aldolase [Bacteroidota bacterium]|jgi:deoxyribose-phosphate aldolase
MKIADFDAKLAAMIDHTLLKPEAQEKDVLRLCDEARTYSFASVCVNPSWVHLCHDSLRGSAARVCTVIGFPLGSNRSDLKMREAELALQDGAEEFDMVLHVGRLKQGDIAYVEREIAEVTAVVKSVSDEYIVKVILEICLLTDSEIAAACRLVQHAGADFVKTSTGFSTGGATLEAVQLMREVVGQNVGVKASGGIRDRAAALAMIDAGANRIGTSSSIAIVST